MPPEPPPALAQPLQRQQLAWLDEYGWYRVLAAADDEGRDPQAQACLEYWAEHALPLVITRQPAGWRGDGSDQPLVLGLPAPARWNRRRLFVESSSAALRRRAEFAPASDLSDRLPAPSRDGWARLCRAFVQQRVTPRIYGSHGWQLLTGLDYVRPDSDIDLLVRVDSPAAADAVAGLLGDPRWNGPRLDGEIVFGDGAAVAWREWADFRCGRVASVLVKRIDGAALHGAGHWRAAA